jgi:hypothetical protein
MRRRIDSLLPAATWMAFALCATATAYASPPVANNLPDLARFLDKAAPSEQRQSIFAGWRDAAIQGDVDAQYVMGSLYRRGDDATPPVLERDTDQARRFLSTAAAHGRLLAMAKMAELELTQDRPLEATIWAQVYGYYRGWAGDAGKDDSAAHPERRPTMYYEDLLRRTSEGMRRKFGDLQTQNVVQQVNAFIGAHDHDIGAGSWRDGIAPRWTGPRLKFENAKSMRRVGVIGKRDMVSEWVLRFAADGSVDSAEAFDALPDFISANGHHSLAMQYEAAKADAAQALRFGMKTIDLKRSDWPQGPAITR